MISKEIAESSTILRGVVGSTLYGLAVSGPSDRDEMGICVEPYEHFFGLRETFEQYTYRDKPAGVRSEPGDLDLTIYSLAKWARLALGGNPTVQQMLFLPNSAITRFTNLSVELMANYRWFIGDSIFTPYLGYMAQQRYRLTREVMMPNRPELVEKYGYDTKYAGHLLRLGYQGIELAETGKLTFPIPEPARSHILDVRVGKFTKEEVLNEATELEHRLEDLRKAKPLPPPNREAVEVFIIDAYMRHYL